MQWLRWLCWEYQSIKRFVQWMIVIEQRMLWVLGIGEIVSCGWSTWVRSYWCEGVWDDLLTKWVVVIFWDFVRMVEEERGLWEMKVCVCVEEMVVVMLFEKITCMCGSVKWCWLRWGIWWRERERERERESIVFWFVSCDQKWDEGWQKTKKQRRCEFVLIWNTQQVTHPKHSVTTQPISHNKQHKDKEIPFHNTNNCWFVIKSTSKQQ